MAHQKREDQKQTKKGYENTALLDQIGKEIQAKNYARSKIQQDGGVNADGLDFDEYEMDDRYGNVLQKDLDKITGGVSVFKNGCKEFKMHADALDDFVQTPEEGARPA